MSVYLMISNRGGGSILIVRPPCKQNVNEVPACLMLTCIQTISSIFPQIMVTFSNY